MLIMQKIGKLLKTFCTALGAVILLVWGICAVAKFYSASTATISNHTALVIDFNTDYSEHVTSDILDDILGRQSVSFQTLIQSIELAVSDDRIEALVAKLNVSSLEMAQIQDVARVVAKFRKSGKKTYVFSQGFGDFGQGNREYYLATFFENIYMQPHTSIGLTGISIEVPFFKKLLHKLGVDAEFFSRYEYKTAMMSVTDENMSAAYKKELQKLENSIWEQLSSAIQENRQLKTEVDKIRDMAPISAEEGVKIGLVDELLYMPQVEQKLKDSGIEEFVNIDMYTNMFQPNKDENLPAVAWLNLSGIITSGENTTEIDGEYAMGSQSVLQEIQAISEINNLKALVVRIDSPGGGYNAADEIYFALETLKKEKQIPIIISQSGYAASGGYYISLAGDYIIAEPTTITGSIGVLGGKFSLAQMWQKIDVNWDSVKIGQNAGILSMNQPFSPSEQKVFNASLDEVYNDFIHKVEQHRTLAKPIDQIARGRVWTGAQAVELGLIDATGGYMDALFKAKELAQLSADEAIRLVVYPQEKTFAEKFQEIISGVRITADRKLLNAVVDIRDLKLFKRLQYDTVLVPFIVKM